MIMKILCVFLLVFACCSDVISARRRRTMINPFCTENARPVRPIRNSNERVSEYKCNLFTYEVSARKWDRKCEGDTGIYNGKKTNNGDYPHMGALGWRDDGKLLFLCGASLISSNFVLTAAHCAYTPHLREPSVVKLGATNLDHPSEIIEIKNIIKHPSYASPLRYYDIALFELNRHVRFTTFLQPACLWTADDLSEHQYNVSVTGWGETETGRQSRDLLETYLDIIDDDMCENFALTNRNWNGMESHQLCAGKLEGRTDTCHGDSGGPIQFTTQNSLAIKIYYVFGVTSFGWGCARSKKPGVYTKVASFIDWIEGTVWPDEYKEFKHPTSYLSKIIFRNN